MIFEILAEIAVSPELKRRRARNKRRATRAATRAAVRTGTEHNARRAEYHARKLAASDLRRVIRKVHKGEPIPVGLRSQIERMRALAIATAEERAKALWS